MQPGWEGVDSRRPRWVPALLIAAVVAVGVASAVALAVGSRDAPARDLRVETGDATRPRPPSSSSDSARAQDRFAAGLLGAGWQALPPSPLPAREDHTAVWTGGEVVFWGGNALAGRNRVRADGAAWDPRERRWRDIRPASGPGRAEHTATWTGDEMLVWGGRAGGRLPRRGLAYDPDRDRWRRLPAAPISGRTGSIAVWTGDELIVWGGVGRAVLGDGAAYDPRRDRWRRLPEGPLLPRFAAGAVWTGDEVLIWGGRSAAPAGDDRPLGAAYDPAGNRWRLLPAAPLGTRVLHSMAWTGTQLLVWGGSDPDGEPLADGAAYTPTARRWRTLPATGLAPRFGQSAAWAGDRLLLWGGVGRRFRRDGAAYVPAEARWLPIPLAPVTRPARYPSAWTGGQLVVWGGAPTAQGAAFRPSASLALRPLLRPYPR